MKRMMFVSSSTVLTALLASATSCSSDSDDGANNAGSGGASGKGGGTFAGAGGSSGAAAAGGTSGAGGSGASGGTGAKGGTGGSSGTGGAATCPQGQLFGKKCADILSPMIDACSKCSLTLCCTELEACFSNAKCAGLNDCIGLNCPPGPDRVACGDRECAACLTEQSVRDIVNAVRSCSASKCGVECGVSDAGRSDAGGKSDASTSDGATD